MLLVALLMAFLLFRPITSKNNVHEYGDSVYFEYASPEKTALVMFYVSHNFQQKTFAAKDLNLVADNLAKRKIPVQVFVVDCALKGYKLCKKYGIDEYPTYKVIRSVYFKTRIVCYKGPVDDWKAIVEHLKQISTIKTFSKLSVLKSYLETITVPSVVAYFHKRSFYDSVTRFEEKFFMAVDKLRDYVNVGYTDSPEIINNIGLYDAFIIHYPSEWQSKFQDANITYIRNGTVKDMNNFIASRMFGILPNRTRLNRDVLVPPLITGYWAKDAKSSMYWKNRFLQFAKKYEGTINFALSDLFEFQTELVLLGFRGLTNDTLIILGNDKKKRMFLFEDKFTNEKFDDFITNFHNSSYKRIRQSEPLPEPNDEQIKTLVGNNFDEMVTNNNKDCFVMFYNPDCVNSQKFRWTFDQLADQLRGEDVLLGKMDITLNEVPEGYEIRSTPTLYWSRKEAKENPVMYKGNTNVTDLVHFIANNATEELKKFDRNGMPKVTTKLEL